MVSENWKDPVTGGFVATGCQVTRDGAHCRFRTYDPYRVKVMLYH